MPEAAIVSSLWRSCDAAKAASFAKRRRIVPADGFYEWRGPKNNREPLWIHPADGGLLRLAEVYESSQPEPGQRQLTFTITIGANRPIEPFHDRMPVVLDERTAEDAESW